ncbi:methyltransferase domain-containing protein [Corynebacterium sp. CCM 8835]|uniref:Methyltransferase domain-containing protein n=1 Tax=Corynebacterium antarcticum TaxID=2800405 RepID=A0ABS1FMN2_9CORY|nr:methyltransferase domain-containing protein [Corynebacterium antarcticum]MCK7642889.1 methyltransferase domain-containing protein [Corynebacterium antarcticum]MCK7661392.1 methyltransferase domain-containing protein [Corynebacterium antarcticum]MCL0246129.1 methyltransferase domain-containing protein [Corynebacterium antarcticum]MCX7492378.1 methyltransferase domain-containing protein [Corynebacterium antarcticum]
MQRSFLGGGEPVRYVHGHDPATLASHSVRTAANSCGYLLSYLKPGMSVLDIGCGPGSITLDLAEIVGPEGRVIGLENTAEPLGAARQMAADRGDSGTRFVVGDVLQLPFPDESFEVVHAHQMLQHVVDPVSALTEMHRVCAPDGVIAVRDADYAAMSWYPHYPGMERWRNTYRELAKRSGGEPDAGRHLRAWAHAAGLVDPVITTSAWTYADTDSCRWWGNGQADRISGAVFRDRVATVLGTTDADVDEMVRGWRSWANNPDSCFTMTHGEMIVIR